MNSILHGLLGLHGLPVYLVVGALTFAEAAILLGFIFPGETAVLLGGVLASRHHVNLDGLIVVVVTCAVVGDSVGYLVGERFGPRLLRLPIIRKRIKLVEATQRFLRRRGFVAVLIARFTAFLRAVTPGLAGMSGLPYRIFLPANFLGGLIWGTGFTLIGYFVGNAYTKVEKFSGWATTGLLVAVVAVLVFVAIRARRIEGVVERGGSDSVAGQPAPDKPSHPDQVPTANHPTAH